MYIKVVCKKTCNSILWLVLRFFNYCQKCIEYYMTPIVQKWSNVTILVIAIRLIKKQTWHILYKKLYLDLWKLKFLKLQKLPKNRFFPCPKKIGNLDKQNPFFICLIYLETKHCTFHRTKPEFQTKTNIQWFYFFRCYSCAFKAVA